MQKIYIFVKNPLQKFVRTAQWRYLCNVFHGIRFKVNKGWDSAEPLFFAFLSETASDSVPFFASIHKKARKTGTPGK